MRSLVSIDLEMPICQNASFPHILHRHELLIPCLPLPIHPQIPQLTSTLLDRNPMTTKKLDLPNAKYMYHNYSTVQDRCYDPSKLYDSFSSNPYDPVSLKKVYRLARCSLLIVVTRPAGSQHVPNQRLSPRHQQSHWNDRVWWILPIGVTNGRSFLSGDTSTTRGTNTRIPIRSMWVPFVEYYY